MEPLSSSTPLYKQPLPWASLAFAVVAVAAAIISALALTGNFSGFVNVLHTEGAIGFAAGGGVSFLAGLICIAVACRRSRRGHQPLASTQPLPAPTTNTTSNSSLPPQPPSTAPTTSNTSISSNPPPSKVNAIPLDGVRYAYPELSGHSDTEQKLRKQLAIAVAQETRQAGASYKNVKITTVSVDETEGTKKVEKLKISADFNSEREKQITSQKILNAGVADTQGWRPTMEDEHLAVEIMFQGQKAYFYGVFDGHGGRAMSSHIKNKLKERLETNLSKALFLNPAGITNALTETIMGIREGTEESDAGSCLTGALILDGVAYVPNVGDSRTLLVRKDTTRQLTEDAKPGDVRFDRAGKKKYPDYLVVGGKACGLLAVARHIGTLVSNRPKISRIEAASSSFLPDVIGDEEAKVYYQAGDRLIIACDGLYDVMSSEKVGQIVRELVGQDKPNAEIARELVRSALALGSGDNITAMVVTL